MEGTFSHPKFQWPGVKEIFGLTYEQHPAECMDLFDLETSDKGREEIVEATSFGLASSQPEGDGVYYDSKEQGSTTVAYHVAYGLGYKVTRQELDDNQYSEVSNSRAAALAFSMKTTKETVAANVFNRAFNSSYTFGDGSSLVATSHATKSGTQSNRMSTDADLTETSLEDMCIDVMLAKNSRGLNIALRPVSLHIAPANFFNAERILKSTLQNDTAQNAVNVIRNAGMLPGGCKVNHYFTDADAWFIRTDVPAGGLTLYQRIALEFEQDNDFDTSNLKAKAYERYSFTNGDFRSVYGSAGA